MLQLADAIAALNDEAQENLTDEQRAILRENTLAMRAAVESTVRMMRQLGLDGDGSA